MVVFPIILLSLMSLAEANQWKTPPAQQQCGENETFVRCSGCEVSCTTPHTVEPKCRYGQLPLTCGQPKCECVESFARSTNGKCVRMEQCAPAYDFNVFRLNKAEYARSGGLNDTKVIGVGTVRALGI